MKSSSTVAAFQSNLPKSRPAGAALRKLIALTMLALATLPAVGLAGTPTPLHATASGQALGVPASTTNPFLYSAYVLASGSSNLGPVTVVAHHTAYADVGALVNGIVVLHARSGYILGTYSGNETPTPDSNVLDVAGNVIFTGGTGAYRHATGNATFNGSLTVLSISPAGVFKETVVLSLSGTITTPGH